MVLLKSGTIFLFTALVSYVIYSKYIFDYIYKTSKVVIDEQFHLPLGEAYCKFEFDKWHPKVTTFPGLYLFSSLLLGHLQLCTTYWLRSVSLICSFINIVLFYILLNISNNERAWKNAISALNLGLLPPLYFFSHVYYTDVASLTMILLMFILSQKGRHYFASIFGIFSVLFRQTNIVWVGMAFGCYALKELNSADPKNALRYTQIVTLQDLMRLLNIFKNDLWSALRRLSLRFWLNASCYIAIFIFFISFVIINGSIVVGDKTAHEVTLHLPQIFYFSLFCLFFTWSHFVTEIENFFYYVHKNKYLMLLAVAVSLAIVHFNTQVHPYLVADNRHYVFYIWNRFYGRYYWFRYTMVPIYLFAIFVIISRVWDKRDVTFLLLFIPCTFLVLVTQRLVELRYFFIPYVLFRTHLRRVSLYSLFYEFLAHVILNICTLSLFSLKTIQWEDFDEPQRIIW